MSFKDTIICKLEDILTKVIDNRGKNPPFSVSGYPYIDTTCIVGTNRYPDYSLIRKYISEDIYKNWFRSGHPQKDDLLIATVGANIGKICLMDQTLSCIAQNTIGLRVNRDKANPQYIYYLLSSGRYQDYLKSLDVGSAQPSIKVPHLLAIDLEIPSLDYQSKIAEILSALDDKIGLNRQTNQTLEVIAQVIYKEWFVNFKFPGATGEMQESELGPIPKGWRVGEYTNELNIVYGKNLPTVNLLPSGYPVFGGNGLIGFYDKYLYKDPQVIVACRGAASGKVNQSLPNSFVTNNSLVFEIPQKSKVKFTYLKQYCLNTDFTSFVSGSAQPQLTIESFKNAFLLIPEERVLRNFDKLILPVEEIIRENDIQSNCLMQIRYFLLPKLMNGEIDV